MIRNGSTSKLVLPDHLVSATDLLKHPLFSAWTLWFDSPSTKGRNLPQTPMTAVPPTPIPQTPGNAAALGWMEDIKKVISFDSVEEFWGYVHPHLCTVSYR